MDLYEYQGKELFRRFGIPVSEGRLATTPEEARAGGGGARRPGRRQGAGADRRPRQGGRRQARRRCGRRGGRRPASILGLDINGHVVRRLWIEQASEIAKEYYLSHHVRPRRQAAALHAHDRGRRRDRAGRRGEPRRARPPAHRSARGLPALPGAATDLRRRDRPTPASRSRSLGIIEKLYALLRRRRTRCSARSIR